MKAREADKGRAKKPDRKTSAGPVIIVGNLKGGSGKSTVAFNLALWLAARGVVADLVDLDPQKTLTDLVAVREEIGARPRLGRPASSLDGDPAGRWTLIDFGAADMERMQAVVHHADIVLVPVIPSQADIWATQRYLEIISARRKPDAVVALFLNRADAPDVSRETRETTAALTAMAGLHEGVVTLSVMLGRRVGFCRSLSEGQGVFEIKKKSKASKEFDAFARTVMALR